MEVCTLDEIGDVGGELLDDGLVEPLHVLEETFVILGDKVDGHTLTTETTGTTDAVEVILGLRREVKVDDEDTCWTSIPRARRSVVINTREDPERNSRMMMSRVFWSMSPCVAETVKSRARILSVSQSTLRRVLAKMTDCVIASVSYRVAQGVELPVLLVDVDVELLDTLEGELVALHENAHRLRHELSRDLERLGRHRRGEDANLDLGGSSWKMS